MKIDIIHPAHYNDNGELIQARKWYEKLGVYIPHLGPALLAALTPQKHEVRLIDEYLENVDYETDADVIAISAQIMQYQRAIDLSSYFQRKGKITVIGGYLASLVPDSVRPHFDCVVSGEADQIWPELLRDIENKRAKKMYVSKSPVDISNLPTPRYDLIVKDRNVVYPVQATRGCPFVCKYCSIASVYKGNYRKRPIEHVVRDIEATKSKNINFCDDNLCEDMEYSERLFDALKGASISWGTQTTINVANKPALLKKARLSGCRLMALGVETIVPANLDDVQKSFQKIDKYALAFQRLVDAGISPHALIIFGLPRDNNEIFKRTLDYLERLKIPVAQFFLFMPYPGTAAGDAMVKENKIIDFNLSRYREPYVIHRPENMGAEELRQGWWNTLEEFYSIKSIFKRVVFNRQATNVAINLATNLYYRFQIGRGIHPVYFGM